MRRPVGSAGSGGGTGRGRGERFPRRCLRDAALGEGRGRGEHSS